MAASPGESLLRGLEDQARVRRRREAMHGFIRHAGVWLGVNAVLWGAARVLAPGSDWPPRLALIWGAGLAVHGLWTWRALRRL
jgi:low temperature requirement protein LtrA